MTVDPEHESGDVWAAETDPTLLGSILASYRARYAWNRHALARWLGITFEELAALAREPLADPPISPNVSLALAERYSADARRLAMILTQRPGTSGANP